VELRRLDLDERELGGHEEAVQRDEQECDEQAGDHGFGLVSRLALRYSLAMRIAALATSALALALCYAPPAWSCGAASAPGSYVRLAAEKTIIVWDGAKGIEHFLRKPVFEGDPKDFGFFVPTPKVPEVAKVDPRAFAELEALVPLPGLAVATAGAPGGARGGGGAVTVEQTVRIDDFELVTLRAGDAHALVDWLGAHGYATRPSLEAWARRYVLSGWVLSAMRYAPKDGVARGGTIDTPAVRLSFAIGEPFYPYTEAPPDAGEELAFHARTKARPAPRALDLWVVAADEVVATSGGKPVETDGTAGPAKVGVAAVAGARLSDALARGEAWLPAGTRSTWTVTRFREVGQRTAFDDLVFRSAGAATGDESEGAPSRLLPLGLALATILGALALVYVLGLTDRSRPER
jgi:hypothetical protein